MPIGKRGRLAARQQKCAQRGSVRFQKEGPGPRGYTVGVQGAQGPGFPETCPRRSATSGGPARPSSCPGRPGRGRVPPPDPTTGCFACRLAEAGRPWRLLGSGGPLGHRTLRGGRVHPLQVQKARPPGRLGARSGLGQRLQGTGTRVGPLWVLNGPSPRRAGGRQRLTNPRASSNPTFLSAGIPSFISLKSTPPWRAAPLKAGFVTARKWHLRPGFLVLKPGPLPTPKQRQVQAGRDRAPGL